MNILGLILLLCITLAAYYVVFHCCNSHEEIVKKDVTIIAFESTDEFNPDLLKEFKEKGAKIYFFTIDDKEPLHIIDRYLNNSIFKRT